MIRQQAFAKTGNRMLKGNLHSHSQRSDGALSPEELVRTYAKLGYDFLAVTDHRIYNIKNYAPDAGILILPGMEMDRGLSNTPGVIHCFHSVCIGPEEGNGFEQDVSFDSGVVADQYEYQKVLDWIHENNNLTVYCHPQWSSTPAREFENLEGNFAMEIWNSISAIEHDIDKDAACWDELLRQGKHIYGVATDDCHRPHHIGNGWIRVNAEPTVDGVLAALKDGAFYSSCGPEIYDFYVEDGRAVVQCSPAKMVRFHYGYSPTRLVKAGECPLERAEFAVPDHYTYIRASVVDADNHIAWTNPIFLK